MLDKSIYRFVFITAGSVYFLGLFIDVMQIDSAQYASISREMADTNHWLQVKHRGKDYLDKPPLLFWLAALSFKLFGIHNWSFRLPALLFTLLGTYATYRLAKTLYDYRTGRLAALMLFTCQAYFLFNHDVRTDVLLTNSIITAIWLLYEYLISQHPAYFIGGFFFVGLGMLAKGPLGLMIPAWTLGMHLLLKKQYRKIFRLQWICGLAIVALLLTPACWGLYQQYGWEGIKFFLWTQSFGRITGENPWRNEAGPFFLLHSFLWAFLPWSALSVYALADIIRAYAKQFSLPEYLSISGFLVTLTALSFSKYKLPHYVFVTLPFAAIFTAEIIETQLLRNGQLHRFFRYIQWAVIIGYALVCIVGYFYVFVVKNLWWPTISFFLLALCVYVYYLKIHEAIMISSAIAAVACNFMLNTHFYPELLRYQSGNVAANIIRQQLIPKEHLYYYERCSHALEFYLQTIIPPVWNIPELISQHQHQSVWIYSEGNLLQHLSENQIMPRQIIELDNYPVQFLRLQFLNPQTRKSTLQKSYLVEIAPQPRHNRP